MEWLPIDINNLPKGEVLAANFKSRSYGFREKLVGHLHINEVLDVVTCTAEDTILYDCTHYIDIHKFDIDL